MFNKERILLFPLFFSVSQNFFQIIWKSFSVNSSDGSSSKFSSCLSSAEFLKLRLANESDETSLETGGIKSFLLISISLFSSSKTSVTTDSFNSEVLIKDFFF